MNTKPRSVNNVFLPDGEYKGYWGGFQAMIPFNDTDSYSFKTDVGIKSMRVPVTIFVNKNEAIIFTK